MESGGKKPGCSQIWALTVNYTWILVDSCGAIFTETGTFVEGCMYYMFS